jgi:hypothetical protein
MRTLIIAAVITLCACTAPAEERAYALASECDAPSSRYEIVADAVPYAEAAARCEELGGELVEFDSTAEIQAIYDAWVTAQYVDQTAPPSEAIWVGTWITNTEGEEYGYAMLRGGALFPVEQDGARLGLPACELPATSVQP